MRRKHRQQVGKWEEKRRGVGSGQERTSGYSPELRLRVVREVLDGQMSRAGASRVFGVAITTIAGWLQRYREQGAEGLKAERSGPPPRTQPGSAVKRELVTAMRREHPQFGTQRVSDMLRRFEGLGVSPTEVRRCLMVLSVLSGEKPVSDAIAEVKLSRGTYYHLEERAMQAMLRALSPLAGPDGTESLGLELALGQVKELEKKVARLEQDKRRLERLLYMTRKVVKPGSLVVEGRRGRPRGRRSTPNGQSGSPASTPTVKTSPSEASTPSSTSVAERSPGSEN